MLLILLLVLLRPDVYGHRPTKANVDPYKSSILGHAFREVKRKGNNSIGSCLLSNHTLVSLEQSCSQSSLIKMKNEFYENYGVYLSSLRVFIRASTQYFNKKSLATRESHVTTGLGMWRVCTEAVHAV